MDDLTTLRRIGDATPQPTDDALESAFAALQQRMSEEPTARAVRRLPRRRVVLTGLGVAAAACLAVTLVNLGPVPSASAASLALQAAATTVAAGDAAAGDTVVHYTRLVTSGGDTGDGGPVRVTEVLLEGTSTLRRTDEAGVWERSDSPLRPIGAWGADRDLLLRQAQDEYAAADGRWTTSRSTDSPYFWEISPKQVAALPRDPEALRRHLQGVTDPDTAYVPNTERAIDAASTVLESGLADATLQAAVYRALEGLPGLLLTEHAKDLDGRPGVGIGTMVSAGRQRIDIVIDPSTGRFLGRTETNVVSNGGAPAGTAYESTAVRPA